MRHAGICSILSIIVGLAVSTARGEVYPFADNFSDSTQSKLNWSQVPADSLKASYNGGQCTLTNQHKSIGTVGLLYHTFSTHVSTFTASCTITRQADSIQAGMWLCLTIPTGGGALTGYIAAVSKGGFFTITRIGATSQKNIFTAQFSRAAGSNDTLLVSRDSAATTTFTVFYNGLFIGSCTDASPLPAGDLGLIVQGNASVIFHNVEFTNISTTGSFPNNFTDSFGASAIDKHWLLSPSQYFSEHATPLQMTAPAASAAYGGVQMTLDTFIARTVVSWRSGDSTQLYGFYLAGPADTSTGVIPMAEFGICGIRAGAAFLSSQGSISSETSQTIKGNVAFPGPISLTPSMSTSRMVRIA